MLQEPMHSNLSIRGEGNRDVAKAGGYQTLPDTASRPGAGNTAQVTRSHAGVSSGPGEHDVG
jgi:hypothetical protein